MSQTGNLRNNFETPSSDMPLPEDIFSNLDARYSRTQVPSDISDVLGKWVLTDHELLSTPPHIQAAGRIQTNPSPFVLVTRKLNGDTLHLPVTWVREEDEHHHLGTSEAVPYYLSYSHFGKTALREFSDAVAIKGEDARVTPGVQMRSPIGGRPHTGWFMSTVHATPKESNPDEAETITQIGYWGDQLDKMEKVCEIHGSKNTTIVPGKDVDKPLIHVFTRPFPYLGYRTLGDPSELNDKTVEEAQENIITYDFLPAGYHMGANNVRHTSNPGILAVETHEAARQPYGDGRNLLHYRLARAAFVLPNTEFPQGKFIPMQVLAERSDFPIAEPKSPDKYVADYMNILYGAIGESDWIITGIGDNRLAVARLRQL